MSKRVAGTRKSRIMHIRELRDKMAFVYAMIPLAAAAVLKGDHERAARSVGAGNMAQAYEAGRSYSIDALLEDIDRAAPHVE
jgi:hypothetical protein